MNVRVMIAEDSRLFLEVLLEILDDAPGIEVVGVTDNGLDAVALCQKLRPDLILMDIQMPGQNGLAATEEIMATYPTPILVITSDPHHGGVDLSFRALSLGALDLMAKPESLPFPASDRATLLRKIHLLSQIPVVRHVRGRKRRAQQPTLPQRASGTRLPRALVGVVASTGGPRALAQICTELPADFAGTLIVVQHITEGFSRHLARWLDKHCALPVIEGRDGLPLLPGQIIVAPTAEHLFLGDDCLLHTDQADPIAGHRPSGDRLLMSLAQNAPRRAIGVVLSGMGNDGAAGLAAIHRAGGTTVAQDEGSSLIFGMPRAAIEEGVVDFVLPDHQIAPRLQLIIEGLPEAHYRRGEL